MNFLNEQETTNGMNYDNTIDCDRRYKDKNGSKINRNWLKKKIKSDIKKRL